MTMAYGNVDNLDEDDIDGHNFFCQIRYEYSLMSEYAQLQRHSIPGVYVLPSGQTSHMWYGLIFIRSGVYQGAIYKFTLTVSKGYPDDGCPEFDFQAGVFHPVVNCETGELDIRREFPIWRRGVDFLYHLLAYAQGIFYNVETRDPLNVEAAKLYNSDQDEYQARVKQSIERCKQEVLAPNVHDPHSIKFAEWNTDVMKAARTMIFEPEFLDTAEEDQEEPANAQVSGLSWVKKGTTQPFSKDKL
ncbi:protein AKTIP homolog [Dysidea avara]|uniref:protein AKTIP homolog n=1 Tax=Dysidea avara TaxID=196820 RepID=UPI003324958A